MQKICSKCKGVKPARMFSKNQHYCKLCSSLYGKKHRRRSDIPRTYLENVYLPKCNDTIYVYNFTGKLHPACPLIVTRKTLNNRVYCGLWNFVRREWFITKTNYGQRWPVVDHQKFKMALKEKQDG